MKLPLTKPLDCGNGDIRDELEMEEPSIREFTESGKETGLMAIAVILGLQNKLDKRFTSRIGISDAIKASEYYMSFTNASPETSEA